MPYDNFYSKDYFSVVNKVDEIINKEYCDHKNNGEPYLVIEYRVKNKVEKVDQELKTRLSKEQKEAIVTAITESPPYDLTDEDRTYEKNLSMSI